MAISASDDKLSRAAQLLLDAADLIQQAAGNGAAKKAPRVGRYRNLKPALVRAAASLGPTFTRAQLARACSNGEYACKSAPTWAWRMAMLRQYGLTEQVAFGEYKLTEKARAFL